MSIIFWTSFWFLVGEVLCGPKVFQPQESGFEPSNRYYESNLPGEYRSKPHNLSTKPERKESKESRFGVIPISPSSYGSGSNGVQNGYGNIGFAIKPMNIDIGGVALGAILGIGLVLIGPKIASILGGGYGGYRSLEGEASTVSDILARIDNSLEQNNLDSTSCIQRTICSYVNSAQKNIRNGEATGLDEFVTSLTNNTLFTYMLDGTVLRQAADLGKEGDVEKCSTSFPKCPLTKDSLLKVLSSFLPA